jgi:hypothetical protein
LTLETLSIVLVWCPILGQNLWLECRFRPDDGRWPETFLVWPCSVRQGYRLGRPHHASLTMAPYKQAHSLPQGLSGDLETEDLLSS